MYALIFYACQVEDVIMLNIGVSRVLGSALSMQAANDHSRRKKLFDYVNIDKRENEQSQKQGSW